METIVSVVTFIIKVLVIVVIAIYAITDVPLPKCVQSLISSVKSFVKK